MQQDDIYTPPLFDEDPDAPFTPAQPRVLKQALAARRAPAPAGPQPSDDLLRQISEKMAQRPDEAALIDYAKQRNEKAGRDFLLGSVLQAKGGSAFAPIGGQVLKQALAEQGDYEIPGGWGRVHQGGVVWNPAKQQEADLGRLTTLYGIQERGETARQTSADRAAALAESRASTAAQRQSSTDLRMQQQNWHAEDTARNHFDQVTKNTRDVLNEARVVATIPTDGRLSPVQQQSLIVLLNKFQDPGSVVREGEFNRVAAAQGLLQKWGNLPQKILSGQPLPPALVRDIQQVIGAYTGAAESTMRSTAADYFSIAKQRRLDPTNIVTDRRWHPADQQQQPGGRGVDVGARLSAGGAPSASGRVQVDF